MVDPYVLTSDIVQTTIYLATPGLLWLFLFLFVWEAPALSSAAGFGRRAFWLLLPGAVLGELANLPFFTWNGDVLAINLGGGLFPLLLSVLVLGHVFGDRARLWTSLLGAFALESYGMLVAVLLLANTTVQSIVVGTLGAVVVLVFGLVAYRRSAATTPTTFQRAALVLGLVTFVLVPTYFTTATVPGLGIVSSFPWYLVPPVAGAIVTVLLARPLLGISRPASIGVAYAVATLGVLVGADLLREPPLYAPGPAGIYAIGGAGVGDLLYLSGLLALVAAFATCWVIHRLRPAATDLAPEARPVPPPVPLTPQALLRQSLLFALAGRVRETLTTSERAVEAAFQQTRRLLGRPPSGVGAGEFEGIAAPAWVQADRRNLAALSQRGSDRPADATRAYLTARWLVGFAREVGRRRFAPASTRGVAFLADLTILTAPWVVVWYAITVTFHGTRSGLLSSVGLNTAALGYAAVGWLYFVLAEATAGTTPGKWLLGLAVRDRELGRPGPLAVALRNTTHLVTLTIVGYTGLLMTVEAITGAGAMVSAPGGLDQIAATLVLLALLLALGIVLPGMVAALVVGATPESQRLGDLWAGTWVVRSLPTPTRAVPVAAPLALPPSG